MVMKYKPRYFIVEELVPPDIFKRSGDAALDLLDDRILQAADTLRSHLGFPLTINNWHLGGERRYSGFRPEDCSVGAPRSQHRQGRALDIISDDMSAASMRTYIQKNAMVFKGLITRIEGGVSWLHIDCKETGLSEIQVFKA
jgi:hypothetical protein